MFGQGMKAARTGDQIDAQVVAGKSLAQNTIMSLQQFDGIEATLNQLAQLVAASGDTMGAMQFEQLKNQIDGYQKQAQTNVQQIVQVFDTINALTDKIQN